MKIACLTATYNRPTLLASCVAQFHRQTHVEKRLFIFDDFGGYYSGFHGDDVQVLSMASRSPTLPHKYALLAAIAEQWQPDAFALIDDDDLYTPDHLSRIAEGLETADWCKPSRIWTTYGGTLHQEPSTGRFWASIGFSAKLFRDVGGFVVTPRMDFDLQMLGRLQAAAGQPYDTVGKSPSYVFRWQDTGMPHSQAMSTGPDDAGWYEKMRATTPPPWIGTITPQLDAAAIKTFAELKAYNQSGLDGGTIGPPARSASAQ